MTCEPRCRYGLWVRVLEKLEHHFKVEYRCVNVRTILEYVTECRSAQQTALWPGVHLADRVVVGIEKVMKLIVVELVAWHMLHQAELLEEPRHMGQVPFSRADLWNRLNDAIFRFQRLNEVGRRLPYAQEICAKRGRLDGRWNRRFS